MKIVKGNVFKGLNDQNRTQALNELHSDSTTYREGTQVSSSMDFKGVLGNALWPTLTGLAPQRRSRYCIGRELYCRSN